MKAQPPPPGKKYFEESCAQWKREIGEAVEEGKRNVVGAALRQVASVYNPELLFEHGKKILADSQGKLAGLHAQLAAINGVIEKLEKAARGEDLRLFDLRLSQIDAETRKAELQILLSFQPGSINTEVFHYGSESWTRFPMQGTGDDRVGVDKKDGKFVDLWLTRVLDSKRLIHFDDPDYMEKLIEGYQVYKSTYDREKEKPAEAPPVEKKAEIANPYELSGGIQEFRRMNEQDEEIWGDLRQKISRIYKGGRGEWKIRSS